jgi:hypothetical protein
MAKMINNDLQNTTQKTKDRTTRTPLKTWDELRYSGRVSSSCSTSGTRRLTLVTNPVISHEWGKDREVLTTSGSGGSDICLSVDVLFVISWLGTMKGWQSLIDIDCTNNVHSLLTNVCTQYIHQELYQVFLDVQLSKSEAHIYVPSSIVHLTVHQKMLNLTWRIIGETIFYFCTMKTTRCRGGIINTQYKTVVVQWPKNMRAISSMCCYKHTCFMLRNIS